MALPRYDPSAVQWRAIIARFGILLPPWLLVLGALFVVVHTRQDRALELLLTEEGVLDAASSDGRQEFLRASCQQLHGDLLWLCLVLAVGLSVAAWVVARFAAQRDASSRRAFHAERLAAIGEAMTALAHESRNAIQRGQASIEMLAKRVRDIPDAEKHLARLQDAQEDLHQLYERVRSYAAPMPLNRRVVDVAKILSEAYADLDPHDDPRGVSFELRILAEDTRANVDPFALRRAFNNVLENALSPENDATAENDRPPRSEVRIVAEIRSLRHHGAAALEISIQDNGPGVPENVARRIFEPFFTTRSRGTGLGMAITRRILEMHGGQFDLAKGTHNDNPSVGSDPRTTTKEALAEPIHGARFVFTFPLGTIGSLPDAVPSPASPFPSASPSSSASSPRHARTQEPPREAP